MKRIISSVLVLFSLGQTATAADLFGPANACAVVQQSSLLAIPDNDALTVEVVRYMTEAVNVADSSEWINSRSSAFTWASEAKVACGKAYGYLQTGYRDEDYVNKCECFHSRMIDYMN